MPVTLPDMPEAMQKAMDERDAKMLPKDGTTLNTQQLG
jgi:hypothetical protein